MLLAIFSLDGCFRMDELAVDGTICRNNFWRENLVTIWYLDCKNNGCRICHYRIITMVGIISLQNNVIGNNMQGSSSGSGNSISSENIKESKSNDNKMS